MIQGRTRAAALGDLDEIADQVRLGVGAKTRKWALGSTVIFELTRQSESPLYELLVDWPDAMARVWIDFHTPGRLDWPYDEHSSYRIVVRIHPADERDGMEGVWVGTDSSQLMHFYGPQVSAAVAAMQDQLL